MYCTINPLNCELGRNNYILILFSNFRCTQIKTYSWDNAQVILVGNKCDMEDERVISFERGKQLADSLGLEFFETSAKENINVRVSPSNECSQVNSNIWQNFWWLSPQSWFFSLENVIHLWMGKACPGVLYQKDKLFSLKKYYAKILMGNPRKIWIVAKTILALE